MPDSMQGRTNSGADYQLDIQIRDATPADQAVIVDFNSRLAEETEGKSLDQSLIRRGVTALLADATKGRYLLAVIDNEAVGQIMVTYEWSDWRNGMFWWIGSVYVSAKHRRSGIFSSMFRHVQSLVEADPEACGIRLYVENRNRRAQDTYRNLGMTEPGYKVMEWVRTHAGNCRVNTE